MIYSKRYTILVGNPRINNSQNSNGRYCSQSNSASDCGQNKKAVHAHRKMMAVDAVGR